MSDSNIEILHCLKQVKLKIEKMTAVDRKKAQWVKIMSAIDGFLFISFFVITLLYIFTLQYVMVSQYPKRNYD